MNLSEYGRTISEIGKNIKEVSLLEKSDSGIPLEISITNNLNICQCTFEKLKAIEAPRLVATEHEELVRKFQNMKNAFSIQKQSMDDKSDIFITAQEIVHFEMNTIQSTLLLMLLKVVNYYKK